MGARTVGDPDSGVSWRVREVDATGTPGARGTRCLVFDSEGVARRVWTYPTDWHDLDPAALLRLSWGR